MVSLLPLKKQTNNVKTSRQKSAGFLLYARIFFQCTAARPWRKTGEDTYEKNAGSLFRSIAVMRLQPGKRRI
jgi:hypothetical protein